MAEPLVLIIGEKGDWSADAVAEALTTADVETFRLTTYDFPQRMTLRATLRDRWAGTIVTAAGTLPLEHVTGVYYRRPRTFDLPAGMSEPERRFARAQARIGLGGLLTNLPAHWVNHPSAMADAEYKPRQLATANAVGLKTPATLLTNDPGAVLDFASTFTDLVVKPLAEPAVAEAGALTVAYCRRMQPADYLDLAGVDTTAHQFQQWINPQYAVRLTAVGERLFPVAIFANSPATTVDWRSDYESLRYEPVTCPGDVEDAVRRYLAALDLVFGAFDFVVDHSGGWWFLECNSAGQWGWLADECDLSIAETLAEELTRGRP